MSAVKVKLTRLLLLVAILSTGWDASAQTKSQAAASADMIFIDGATSPELVPEHMLWSMGFRTMTDVRRDGTNHLLESLRMSPKELTLVYATAAMQKERDKTCDTRGRQAVQAEKKKEKPQLLSVMRKVTLECRWELLTAKDQLLNQLSAEAAASLTAWMEQWRAHTTLQIHKTDIEFYRQPR